MAAILTAWSYPGGDWEVGWSYERAARATETPRQVVDSEENRERAARRAGAVIRRFVLKNAIDRMLTLTYRENMQDSGKALRDLRELLRRIKKRGWVGPWVAVPERQGRGAWHWHIGVKGWQDVKMIRAEWRGIVSQGNIDVTYPRGGSPRGVVSYLIAYIKKDAKEVQVGAYRYQRSRGKLEPDIRIKIVRNVVEWVNDLLGKSLKVLLLHPYGGWGATWSTSTRVGFA